MNIINPIETDYSFNNIDPEQIDVTDKVSTFKSLFFLCILMSGKMDTYEVTNDTRDYLLKFMEEPENNEIVKEACENLVKHIPYLEKTVLQTTKDNQCFKNAYIKILKKFIDANLEPVLKDFPDTILFVNTSYDYDETEKQLLLTGTSLPDETEVEYTTNKLTNVGSVVATARLFGNSYNEKSLTATLTIQIEPGLTVE